ncbi:hypothetical protein DSL72_001319 [Monilinia vaccinii-corymbosi]|uniref:2EXR domain-containing protein n=1 Tax=Monilinia vaccinii-corymbosi TaxID=61207 RepID=A0A8A3P7L3_9HELO|nr:hypothetical protein DSL72_001319 [Monilinia vaccinii-corymbosi]
MSDLTEFTLFPKLHPEVRAIIWELASQAPNRILFFSSTISARNYPKRKANTPISDRDRIFCGRHPDYPAPVRAGASSRVPSVLRTSRESRYWAMKHYSLSFQDQLYTKALWFNPKVDLLIFDDIQTAFCFGSGGCMTAIGCITPSGPIPLIKTSSTMPVVERVVVQKFVNLIHWIYCKDAMKNFPHLKSLVIQTHGNSDTWREIFAWYILGPDFTHLGLERALMTLRDSDEWKEIRRHDKKPGFQIMNELEMWDAGLTKPLGPSYKQKHRPRVIKASAAQTHPLRCSNRIRAITAARDTKQLMAGKRI